jgi:hypothetical protein
MRITIGDVLVQQPVVMTSLGFDYDLEAPWEINIEDDPNMMQAPMKIGVSMQFNVVSDYLPQKGGRFFTLAKRFVDGQPVAGNNNWLSDTKNNLGLAEALEREKRRVAKSKTKSKGMEESTKIDISKIASDAIKGN